MMRSKVVRAYSRCLRNTALLFALQCGPLVLPDDASAESREGRKHQGLPYAPFSPESRRGGPYGVRTPVATVEDATQAIEKCLSIRNKGLRAGRILDNRGYFQLEIVDKNGEPVDSLIVMKRNGRVRSIYEPHVDTEDARGVLSAKG